MILIKRFFIFFVGVASISGAFAGVLDAPKKQRCESINNWVGELIKLNGGGIPVKPNNGTVPGPRPSVYFVAKNLAPHMLSEGFSKYVGKPFDELSKKEKKFISKYLMKCSGKNLIYVAVAFSAKKGSRDDLAWKIELKKVREEIARRPTPAQLAQAEEKRYASNRAVAAHIIGGDLDYLTLSEEKLGVKFDVVRGRINFRKKGTWLVIKEVFPGGKADKANISKGMIIEKFGFHEGFYHISNFKRETELIFVTGVARKLYLTVLDGPNLYSSIKKIYFEGESLQDYRNRQREEKQILFVSLLKKSEPFWFDHKLIVPFDKKYADISLYKVVGDAAYSAGPGPGNYDGDVEIYDSNGNVSVKFHMGNPVTEKDILVEKIPEVFDAFRGEFGLIGKPTLLGSYLLAVNDPEMLSRNYHAIKSLFFWKNNYVAFAIAYADVCGSAMGSPLVTITRTITSRYTSNTSQVRLEKELLPLAEEFSIDRNNVIGESLNGLTKKAIRQSGCQSKYVRNLRKNILSFANYYQSGKLNTVKHKNGFGSIDVIEFESYKQLLNIH